MCTNKEALGEAELARREFKDTLEKYALHNYACLQDLTNFFQKGIGPVLREPLELEGTIT